MVFWGGERVAHARLTKQTTKRLLVIYTGGTIGMVATDHGYDVQAGYLAEQLRQNPTFNSRTHEITDGVDPNTLILERSPRGYRVEYTIKEYTPLLDSSNITVTDWVRLARDIAEAYDRYDGFIVLHGTDTMAYTASVRHPIL
jgi:L-asparaginase/Glu-tRNA(Gln) amidotransferase subunit D